MSIYYFDDTSVRFLETEDVQNLPENTLALISKDSRVSNVAKTTMYWSVMATTPDDQPSKPCYGHLRPRHGQLDPLCWVMDLWSEEEIASLE